MKISHPSQLSHLRNLAGLPEIHVDANAFLFGNLPLYLFKYVVWALEEGGIAYVTASQTIDCVGLEPGLWSFQFLIQATCKAIEGIGTLVAVDTGQRMLQFRRTTTVAVKEPWSAVIMFSGKEAELPLLDACLKGLITQPELVQGGQIAVCGPANSSHMLDLYPSVEYLDYETPIEAGRFLVGKKKNYAITHMRHDRVLVCHTRIVLEPDCLRRIPYEFDVITPRTWIVDESGRRISYLDLLFITLKSTAVFTTKVPLSMGYPRECWQRNLTSSYPYIDGGLFCVKRSVIKKDPLSEVVAWGEGEDVEWCRRLLVQGRLVELCVDASAVSLVHKTSYYIKWGHYPGYSRVSRGIRMGRVALNVFFQRVIFKIKQILHS